MTTLYLMTAPRPPVEGTDAVVQEAEALRARFGGHLVHLVPGSRPRPGWPRPFYGLHLLRSLRALDRRADLFHVFHAELYPFPLLGVLKKPVVYTVTCGLGRGRLPSRRALGRLGAIAVPTRADRDRLTEAGFTRAHLVPAGIDVTRFTDAPLEIDDELVLLAGSAPWTKGQFRTKGLDALLEVVRRTPSLRLVLLWRGWLQEEVRRRVQASGLSRRVRVVEDRVEVGDLLRRVHAAVVLADAAALVKAYPHSLLEALASGRPVLVSDTIAMAEYVRETDCGLVVRGVSAPDLEKQLRKLRGGYERLRENARRVGKRDFSRERVLEAYGRLYQEVAGGNADLGGPLLDLEDQP